MDPRVREDDGRGAWIPAFARMTVDSICHSRTSICHSRASICHSREGGNPCMWSAFAGMTGRGMDPRVREDDG